MDFLIKLANNRWLAIEVKNAPINFTVQQLKLLDKVKLNIIERWVVSPEADPSRVSNCRSVSFDSVHDELKALI